MYLLEKSPNVVLTKIQNFIEIQSSRFRWYSFVFARTQSHLVYIWINELNVRNDQMDDNNFQNSLCITSMKQKLSGPIEAHGPFIYILPFYKTDQVRGLLMLYIKTIHHFHERQKMSASLHIDDMVVAKHIYIYIYILLYIYTFQSVSQFLWFCMYIYIYIHTHIHMQTFIIYQHNKGAIKYSCPKLVHIYYMSWTFQLFHISYIGVVVIICIEQILLFPTFNSQITE